MHGKKKKGNVFPYCELNTEDYCRFPLYVKFGETNCRLPRQGLTLF